MNFKDLDQLDAIITELKGEKELLAMLNAAAFEDACSIGEYEQGIFTIWKLLASSIDRLDALNATMTAQFKAQRQASTAITKC